MGERMYQAPPTGMPPSVESIRAGLPKSWFGIQEDAGGAMMPNTYLDLVRSQVLRGKDIMGGAQQIMQYDPTIPPHSAFNSVAKWFEQKDDTYHANQARQLAAAQQEEQNGKHSVESIADAAAAISDAIGYGAMHGLVDIEPITG